MLNPMDPVAISAMTMLSVADLIVLLIIFRTRKKEKRVSPVWIVLLIIFTVVLAGVMYPLFEQII